MRTLRTILLIVTTCVSCLDPYSPPTNLEDPNLLVVDGYIDANGSAYVKLSRTLPLYSLQGIRKESGAQVSIRSSSGESIILSEGDSSVYSASNINVTTTQTYSLQITTRSGQRYESDNVKIYPTPDVDKIYVRVRADGASIDIVTDSDDNNPNSTGYYLIDCIETWQYHMPLRSLFRIVGDDVVARTEEEMITDCWKTQSLPTTISDSHLRSVNSISGHRITTILKGSQKVSTRYSPLVRQRAISKEEYEYRERLLASTEQLGSLFSVIPGPVAGNIHTTGNSSEYVLGYFRGQEIKEKRAFFGLSDLPEAMLGTGPAPCQIEYTCPKGQPQGPCFKIQELGSNAIVVSRVTNSSGGTLQVGFVQRECADCTAYGGVTTKPSFW